MTHCVEKLPHAKCGSSDALQVFETKGKYTGYCFRCDEYIPSPYGDKEQEPKASPEKSPEDIQREVDEVSQYPIVARKERHLHSDTLKWYGVTTSLSEQDGSTPVVSYYPYTRGSEVMAYKAKLIPSKEMWVVGSFKGAKDLFGWQQAITTGARVLYVTEGEEDACALYQALRERQAGTKWEHLRPAVVSLTSGASGANRDIASNLSKIKANFKEVVLVFDSDEPGRQAEKDVLQVLPTAKTVSLPAKDANACIIEGKSIALANACLFKTATPKNTRIVLGNTLYEAGREQARYGVSYPWEGMTKLTRGMRFGETYYLGAGVKMGKSEVRNTLAAHLITEHNLKVFLAAPEETNRKTWQMVCGKVANRVFHDPDKEFDFDAYDKAKDVIGDNLYLLNLYQHLGWDSLRSDIMVAAQEGCKAVFIDPITNLTNGIGSGEANTALQEISQELAAIALDLELVIWIFCHLKAPDSGDPHERGGRVMSNQFAGSRAMMRSCHMMVSLEGNKDPDIGDELRCMRRLVVLEDREFGSSGYVNMHYNLKTGQYKEVVNE
jgi:twinkle protein